MSVNTCYPGWCLELRRPANAAVSADVPNGAAFACHANTMHVNRTVVHERVVITGFAKLGFDFFVRDW